MSADGMPYKDWVEECIVLAMEARDALFKFNQPSPWKWHIGTQFVIEPPRG